MTLPNRQSPTHAEPSISFQRFKAILATHKSPAYSEAQGVWNELLVNGVDPSFMLAQYRVESQMGTAGWAKITGSIGNMLYDKSLCLNASGSYHASNGYTYATYSTRVDATKDYCNYLAWYRDHYGFDTIYEATARWIGKIPGSQFHISYVDSVVNDMVAYGYPKGTFYQSGDGMIYAGAAIGKDPVTKKLNGQLRTRYPIAHLQELYRGTLGSPARLFDGAATTAWYLGPINGDYDSAGNADWGAVIIGSPVADPDGTVFYIKNVSRSKVVKVA